MESKGSLRIILSGREIIIDDPGPIHELIFVFQDKKNVIHKTVCVILGDIDVIKLKNDGNKDGR